jgi:hypothetical protein
VIVDRPDAALGDGDPDQHRGDGLGHRPRREAMPIVPRVLVALEEDRVAPRDEEPGRGVAPEVVVEGERLAIVLVADDGLGGRAAERRRRGRPAHDPALEHMIEMTLRAHEEGQAEIRRLVTDRIAGVRAVLAGVRATGREPWPRPG